MWDRSKKLYLCYLVSNNLTPLTTVPFEWCAVYPQANNIKSLLCSPTMDHIIRSVTKQSFLRKGRLNERLFKLVNWGAISSALDSSSQNFLLWAVKHVTGLCATNLHRVSILKRRLLIFPTALMLRLGIHLIIKHPRCHSGYMKWIPNRYFYSTLSPICSLKDHHPSLCLIMIHLCTQ